MRIPLEFYDQLRAELKLSDIVRKKVMLTKKGREYQSLCPFHQEKTPSFTVNDIKRFYHCFGCNAHGDVIRFVAETRGISYKDAAVVLAEENGIELPKFSKEQEQAYREADQLYTILELASKFFTAALTSEIRDYLTSRNINDEMIKNFSIGYAPSGDQIQKYFDSRSIPLKDLISAGLFGRRDDGKIYSIFHNRIMFPIRNLYNKVVGFGGRAIGDAMPKYLNSPETLIFKKGETVYGENIAAAEAHKKNYLIVVEGYIDLISMHGAGYKEAVAILGTAMNEKHLQKLWRLADEIIICLDGDEAGIRASNRLINISLPLINTGKTVSFIRIPGKADPDDIIRSGGRKQFDLLLRHRLPLSEMIWLTEYAGQSFNSAEKKAALEQKLNHFASLITDRSIATNFRRYFKDQIWKNLISKNYLAKKDNSVSFEVINTQSYNESEMLEEAICRHLIKFPEILDNQEIRTFLIQNEFKNVVYDDFKSWLLEQNNLTRDAIGEAVKITGFNNTFLVLSSPGKFGADLSLTTKDTDEQMQIKIFKWLSKKHYLLKLKEEYHGLVTQNAQSADLKSALYLEEIQKTTRELNYLTEIFND